MKATAYGLTVELPDPPAGKVWVRVPYSSTEYFLGSTSSTDYLVDMTKIKDIRRFIPVK